MYRETGILGAAGAWALEEGAAEIKAVLLALADSAYVRNVDRKFHTNAV